MIMTLDINQADTRLIERQAALGNMTSGEFIINAARKAARNAEYLAKIDRGIAQMNEGKYRTVTDEELEEIRNNARIVEHSTEKISHGAGTILTWEQLEKLAHG